MQNLDVSKATSWLSDRESKFFHTIKKGLLWFFYEKSITDALFRSKHVDQFDCSLSHDIASLMIHRSR